MTITVARLASLLGFQPASLALETHSIEERDGTILERLSFRSAEAGNIRGLLTRPAAATAGRLPALLYAHAHGGRYDIGASELIEGRPALLSAPGPMLAYEGYVTLCIDMPTFGARSSVTESSAAKAALWHGRTLFGQMLSEQAGALSWLASRPDVDPGHIGMTGISMGATLAYFLAALDTRIAATAHLCCYADFATLVESGAHDLHGHYLTVPGLLAETSTGEIAGLCAPRPQLICVGLDDPLTPQNAIERAFAQTSAAYETRGAREALTLRMEQGVGHRETQTMRGALLDFFRRHL